MPTELLQNLEWDEVGEPFAGIPTSRIEPASTGPISFLPHGSHPGCSLTLAFSNLIGIAPVAVVVVDPQGYFIYGNQEAESLLGRSLLELTSRHILDVVDAEATWVVSEFEQLNLQQYWSGRALLRRPQGDPIKVAVNAFSNPLPKGGAEHVALLHPTFPDGPAIIRLPDAAALYGLTAHDIRLLQLLAEGFADKELAALLGVSVWTINKDVGVVLRKLHASSRTAACITAVRAHIIV